MYFDIELVYQEDIIFYLFEYQVTFKAEKVCVARTFSPTRLHHAAERKFFGNCYVKLI